MNIKLHLLGRALAVSLLSAAFGAATTSCVDNSDTQEEDTIAVAFDNIWPEGMDPSGILSATLNLRELNTGTTYTVNPMSTTLATLPLGVYDYTGSVTVAESQVEGGTVEKTLRTVGSAITINVASRVGLTWFYSNPGGSLVFSEIYAAGSPNATATGGLRDSYIRIYNNSDRTVYADGIGIAESAFVNSRTNAFEILTPANNRQVNFTAAPTIPSLQANPSRLSTRQSTGAHRWPELSTIPTPISNGTTTTARTPTIRKWPTSTSGSAIPTHYGLFRTSAIARMLW